VLDEFALYLRLGFGHITDVAGYDHILFVLACCAVYGWREWRTAAVQVTAFTLGHTVTLALATLRLVTVSSALVEFLIPLTVVATCVANLRDGGSAGLHRTTYVRYLITAAFGCIHGLGFSTYLRALLGAEDAITWPLFAFNVGLELGQLVIVAIGLAVGAVVTRRSIITPRQWAVGLSLIVGAIASWLAIERSIL
jgi:hypothetical protein